MYECLDTAAFSQDVMNTFAKWEDKYAFLEFTDYGAQTAAMRLINAIVQVSS